MGNAGEKIRKHEHTEHVVKSHTAPQPFSLDYNDVYLVTYGSMYKIVFWILHVFMVLLMQVHTLTHTKSKPPQKPLKQWDSMRSLSRRDSAALHINTLRHPALQLLDGQESSERPLGSIPSTKGESSHPKNPNAQTAISKHFAETCPMFCRRTLN